MEFFQITLPTLGKTLPTLKHPEHGILTTNPTLCDVLGADENKLEWIRNRYAHRLPTLSPSFLGHNSIEFIRKHKASLGLQRVGTRTVFWPLKSMLDAAFHLHTDQAWEFHQEGIRLLESTILVSAVTQEQYETLARQVTEMREILQKGITTASGSVLTLNKSSKLRLVV